MEGNVTPFRRQRGWGGPPPPSEPQYPTLRALGVFWRSGHRLSTMPADEAAGLIDEGGGRHAVRMGAIVCRREHLKFTVILPAMRQPINPEFLGTFVNDNQETEDE